ncbi:PH domain-containing protein [Carboxylicivirga sp. N1Y90]|uniref:PH domain-containing protein n=1 Tax=Carboxylicivirga fragile TaxID=3417571 RepID=UPI003D327484|nr:PH domain-containing protein [Marinilabiliaceae bacterium N1Y90]
MNKIDLTTPMRQSPKGLLLILVMSLQKMIRAFWPMLIIYFWKNEQFVEYQLEIFAGIGILVVLLVAHAILYYLNFKFHVEKDSFILRKGYLRKQELNIPFERIQSVNYKANVLQRLLKVVSLEIDTAGSVKKELKIMALEMDFAEALKNALNNTASSEETKELTEDAPIKKESSKKLIKLQLGELIKIGLLQNHLQMALIILAFGWQFYNELADTFKEEVSQVSGQVNEQVLQSSLLVIIFMCLLFLAISVVASVIKIIVKFFEFEFTKTEASFQMQAGLLNRKNLIIPFKKIQELSWGTNPLKKAFSLFSIKIKQANSQFDKNKSIMEIPGCEKHTLNQLQEVIFSEDEFLIDRQYKISRKFFWRILLAMGCLPVLISLPLYIFNVVHFTIPVVWFAFSICASWLAVEKRSFRMSENQLIISKGMFGQDWKQLELYKIQVVDFRQSIFQKRSGLASIQIYTASGSTTIPFIAENLAKELHKYLVYKIQATEKSWM